MRTAQYGNRIPSAAKPISPENIDTSRSTYQGVAETLPEFKGLGPWTATCKSRQALRPGGSHNVYAVVRRRYWDGVLTRFMESGFFARMKAMTFHSSSEVLAIPPKGGIGPTTTSLRTRL
jgi:hypothetical protein